MACIENGRQKTAPDSGLRASLSPNDSGQFKTTPDDSGQFQTTPEDFGQFRTTPDNSKRLRTTTNADGTSGSHLCPSRGCAPESTSLIRILNPHVTGLLAISSSLDTSTLFAKIPCQLSIVRFICSIQTVSSLICIASRRVDLC